MRNLYRVDQRNIARENGRLGTWRNLNRATHANNTAKISEQREQCAQARQALAIDKLQNPSTWPQRTNRVLHDFWNGQPHTRVVSRILKELREQMRLDNVRIAA